VWREGDIEGLRGGTSGKIANRTRGKEKLEASEKRRNITTKIKEKKQKEQDNDGEKRKRN